MMRHYKINKDFAARECLPIELDAEELFTTAKAVQVAWDAGGEICKTWIPKACINSVEDIPEEQPKNPQCPTCGKNHDPALVCRKEHSEIEAGKITDRDIKEAADKALDLLMNHYAEGLEGLIADCPDCKRGRLRYICELPEDRELRQCDFCKSVVVK